MALRKTAWWVPLVFLLLTIILFGSAGSEVLAKKPEKTTPIKNKWAVIKGFRSAKFGMDEKKVRRAIFRDFKVRNSKIKKSVHPIERTTNLVVTIPDLMEVGGTANVNYILGFKSKKLSQVNIVWGGGKKNNRVDPLQVVSLANLLRDHFVKRKYKKENLLLNYKVDGTTTVVFRGQGKNGRMILLVLSELEAKQEKTGQVLLRLSYFLDHDDPDILTVKEGEF